MTNEEALKVLTVISEADSGCFYCVASLFEELTLQLPEIPWEEVAGGITTTRHWTWKRVIDKVKSYDS